jgi:hypothetical protein
MQRRFDIAQCYGCNDLLMVAGWWTFRNDWSFGNGISRCNHNLYRDRHYSGLHGNGDIDGDGSPNPGRNSDIGYYLRRPVGNAYGLRRGKLHMVSSGRTFINIGEYGYGKSNRYDYVYGYRDQRSRLHFHRYEYRNCESFAGDHGHQHRPLLRFGRCGAEHDYDPGGDLFMERPEWIFVLGSERDHPKCDLCRGGNLYGDRNSERMCFHGDNDNGRQYDSSGYDRSGGTLLL